jgi:hypothetical protein
MSVYDLDAFLERLAENCRIAGSQTAYAAAVGVSKQYINDVLNRRRDPGEKLLDGMKMERIVRYQYKMTP